MPATSPRRRPEVEAVITPYIKKYGADKIRIIGDR